MHDLDQKQFVIFLCFQFLFRKSCFICLSLFSKTSPPKMCDSLHFFSLLFLLNLFSFFVSSLYFYSPCRHSSYSLFLHVFFFLFPCFLSLRLLSLCLFTFCLRLFHFVCGTFLVESPLFLVFWEKHFPSVAHLKKNFFVLSHFLFRPFIRIASFFNRVLSKKINRLFSENHFFNPPRT